MIMGEVTNFSAAITMLFIFVGLSIENSLDDNLLVENLLQNISDSDGIVSLIKRHICYKTSFCTSSAPSEDSSSDCCKQCSCSANCFEFGNCCPDVVNVTKQNLTVSCKNFDEIYLVNQTYEDFWPQLANDERSLQSYYIIDSCFQDNSTEFGDLCTVETVDDLAPVMDVENNILYKNRKCATCNGAENVIDLNVQHGSCSSESFEYNSPVAIVKDFYRACEPVILPPENVEWNFECYENLDLISQCQYDVGSVYYDWGENYDFLEKSCKNDSLIFPVYTAPASYYKNPFCFLCNIHSDDVASQIITQTSSCVNPSDAKSSARDVTTGNSFPRSRSLVTIRSSTQSCDSDDMIFNPELGRCQELRCPIYHVPKQGTCQRYMAVDPDFLRYELLFKVASPGSIQDILSGSSYSEAFIDTAKNFLESNLDCEIERPSLFDSDTLSVVFRTTATCNDENFVSFFRVIFTYNSFKIDILGDDNSTFSFTLTFLYDWGNQAYQSNGIFRQIGNPIPLVTVQLNRFMFYCEHLGFSENDLADLSLSSQLVEERFVDQKRSNDSDSFVEKYFICIEDYIQLPFSASIDRENADPLNNLTENSAYWVTATWTGSLYLTVFIFILLN